jgi:putative hemolysin
MGCASIGMADGGHAAASLYNSLSRTALCPIEYRVFPRCALPLDALDGGRESAPPPLIKGYLRLGAYVCGEPAWDPDFGTADLLMMLPVAHLDPRYARHFLKNEPPPQAIHP